MPEDYSFDDTDDHRVKEKITDLSGRPGYSLFYMHTGENRQGAGAQGLGQVGQGEGEKEFFGDQNSEKKFTKINKRKSVNYSYTQG